MSELKEFGDLIPLRDKKCHRGLGITRVVIGFVIFVLEILKVVAAFRLMSGYYLNRYFTVLQGFWSAPFIIIAGALGIALKSARPRALCLVVGTMVLSIFSAAIALEAVILQPILASWGFRSYYYCRDWQNSRDCSVIRGNVFAATCSVMQAILFLAELVLSITQAAFSCKDSCCCIKKQKPQQQTATVQYVFVPQGQGLMMSQQAPAYPVLTSSGADNPTFSMSQHPPEPIQC